MVEPAPYCHVTASMTERYGCYVLVGEVRLPTPRRHRHPGLEVVVLHRGTARVFYDAWTALLTPGTACIGLAHVAHGSQGFFTRTVLHVSPDVVPAEVLDRLDPLLRRSVGLRVSLDADATRRLLWLADELRHAAGRMHPAVTRALVGAVFAELTVGLERSADPGGQRTPEPILDAIIAHMARHMDRPETLEQLARRFRISRSYMTQLFQQHTGSSPGEYWCRLRLSHACRLLTEHGSVEAVARAVGFETARGLQRAFRRHFGMTPTQYLRRTATPSDGG